MEIIEIASTFIGLRRFKDLESGHEVYFEDHPAHFWEKGLVTNFVKQAFKEFGEMEKKRMGGNDTQDKYGRPYELDDSKEQLYDRLEESRDALEVLDSKIGEFKEYLEKELEECNSPSMTIEFAQTSAIQDKFMELFYLHVR